MVSQDRIWNNSDRIARTDLANSATATEERVSRFWSKKEEVNDADAELVFLKDNGSVDGSAGDKKDAKSVTDKSWLISKELGTTLTAMRGRSKNAGMSIPPRINATTIVRHTKRYAAQTSGVTVYPVSANNLAGALGSTCYVANTSARAAFATARIISITVWPSQDSSAVGNVADVRWVNSVSSFVDKDVDYIVNLPLGISVTRALTFKPPKQTFAGLWTVLGSLATTNMFTLELSEGSIVDICTEATLGNNMTGATVTLTTTQPIGAFGYTPLNGSGGGLVPLGVATVF